MVCGPFQSQPDRSAVCSDELRGVRATSKRLLRWNRSSTYSLAHPPTSGPMRFRWTSGPEVVESAAALHPDMSASEHVTSGGSGGWRLRRDVGRWVETLRMRLGKRDTTVTISQIIGTSATSKCGDSVRSGRHRTPVRADSAPSRAYITSDAAASEYACAGRRLAQRYGTAHYPAVSAHSGVAPGRQRIVRAAPAHGFP
jgi:hypothetical protein